MQSKYQQVFKNHDNDKRERLTCDRKTRSKKSEDIFYRTEGRRDGRDATKSSLEWNAGSRHDLRGKERDRRQR